MKFDTSHIAKSCVAARIRLLNRVITSVYDEALRPYGMKVSQVNIMVVLNGLGSSRAADLCKYLQMDPSTISRNLDKMRENDWILVKSGEGKSQTVTISANGYRKLEEVDPAWHIAQQKAEAILGEGALESIMEVGNDILFCRHKVLNGMP